MVLIKLRFYKHLKYKQLYISHMFIPGLKIYFSKDWSTASNSGKVSRHLAMSV